MIGLSYIIIVCVVRAWRSAALGIPSLSETSTDCGVRIGKRAGSLLLSRAVGALVDEQDEKGWGENAGGCEPAAWLTRSRRRSDVSFAGLVNRGTDPAV